MANYPICGAGITVAYRDYTGEGDTLAMACHDLRERLTRWGATIAPESEVAECSGAMVALLNDARDGVL